MTNVKRKLAALLLMLTLIMCQMPAMVFANDVPADVPPAGQQEQTVGQDDQNDKNDQNVQPAGGQANIAIAGGNEEGTEGQNGDDVSKEQTTGSDASGTDETKGENNSSSGSDESKGDPSATAPVNVGAFGKKSTAKLLGNSTPVAIENVTVNVAVPSVGATNVDASTCISVPDGANYSIKSATWPLDQGNGVELTKAGPLENKQYYINISLETKSGYAFSQGDNAPTVTVQGAEKYGDFNIINSTDGDGSVHSEGSFAVAFTPSSTTNDTANLHVYTPGHGKVLVNGTDYGTEFKGTYPVGKEVPIEAVPSSGYGFSRWWIRQSSDNTRLVRIASTTVTAGTDTEAEARFGLIKAPVTVTPPAAGSSGSSNPPSVKVPSGAGYSVTESKWVGENSTLGALELKTPNTFEAGKTYYMYVKLHDGEDSFSSGGAGGVFETELDVTGGTKTQEGTRSQQDGIVLEAIIAVTVASETGYKDVWIDNTVDKSTSTITATVNLTGSGGTQAGYNPVKTVYEAEKNVPYSTPKTEEVQTEINNAEKTAYDLANGVKKNGAAGEFHMTTTESTGQVWDHRKYDTVYAVIGGPGITTPISVEPTDTKDQYKDSNGTIYSIDTYQISRTHVATGDYGKKTYYKVEVNGWVSGYTVTASAAGNGTATADLTESLAGETVSISATPATGYEFDKWVAVTSDLTIEDVNAASTTFTMPASNAEVKATFKSNKVTVTFDTKGGKPVPVAQTFTAGGKATKPTDPTRDGWNFRGWYTDTAYTEESKFDFNTAVTKDTTLYAGWAKTLTLIPYDLTKKTSGGGAIAINGSTPATGVIIVTHFDGTSDIAAAAPAEGYRFVGWNTSASRDNIVSIDAKYSLGTDNLYALFEEKPPVLTLHASSIDGDDFVEPIKIEVAKGTTISQALEQYKSGTSLDTELFKRDGYKDSKFRTNKPITDYTSEEGLSGDSVSGDTAINADKDIYYIMYKEIDKVSAGIESPVCGTETSNELDSVPYDQTNPPAVSVTSGKGYRLFMADSKPYAFWTVNRTETTPFEGMFKGDETYYARFRLHVDFGYVFSENPTATLDNAEVTLVQVEDATNQKNLIIGGAVKAVHDWGDWEVIKEPTETEDGLEERFCKRVDCGAHEERVIPKLVVEYSFTSGDGSKWTKGSTEKLNFVVKRNRADETTIEHFKGLKVDGKDVPSSGYAAKAGSVVIDLMPAYLGTLADGDHTLTAVFDDGNKETSASFKVLSAADKGSKDKANSNKKGSPATGDEAQMLIWLMILCTAGLALSDMIIRRLKNDSADR